MSTESPKEPSGAAVRGGLDELEIERGAHVGPITREEALLAAEADCIRCGRRVDEASDEFVDWEVVNVDGSVEVCCPHCLTAEEIADIETGAKTTKRPARCARCGRERPEFDAYGPESRYYGDPLVHGWYVLEEGIVCAACVTSEEMNQEREALERGKRMLDGDDA
jgi:hypothetical protein